jgi:CheY-like chemotaxis protein
VDVESTIGLGSCFTVTLPYISIPTHSLPIPTPPISQPIDLKTKPERLNNKQSAPISQSTKPALILLAEDSEANTKTIVDFLEQQGYEIIQAQNGQEAVDMANASHPNLILMDIQMPIMDGLDATRQIRSLPAIADIPVIALTALAMPNDREKCLEAGANSYLSKPVKLKQLLLTIQQILKEE